MTTAPARRTVQFRRAGWAGGTGDGGRADDFPGRIAPRGSRGQLLRAGCLEPAPALRPAPAVRPAAVRPAAVRPAVRPALRPALRTSVRAAAAHERARHRLDGARHPLAVLDRERPGAGLRLHREEPDPAAG